MALDQFSIGGALLGGLMSQGGQSTGNQTVNRDPWGPSQEWLKSLIGSGQNLQNYYQQNPISGQQQAAYGNQFGLSDQARRTMPGLLGQMSSTQFFDRTKPLDRPEAYNFNPAAASTGTAAATFNNPFLTSPEAVAKPISASFNPNQFGTPSGASGGLDGNFSTNGFDNVNNTSALTSQIAGTLGNLGLNSLSDAIAAANGANFSHEGKTGGYGPSAVSDTPANENDNGGQSLGIGDFGLSIGDTAGDASGNDGSSGVAWAKGGLVNKVAGPNPKGPDDGWGMLKKGEFVVKKPVAQKNMGLLKDLNDDGKLSKKGLLADVGQDRKMLKKRG